MKKIIARMLVLVLLLAPVLSTKTIVQAENEKKTTSRAIYVVFDNSGSMYGPGNKAWSQATYAMEVFTAMMNFENGDTMKIFPMHNVTTEGNGGSNLQSSIAVSSQADISQIHNMYTPSPGGTPYTQVNNAAAELTQFLGSGGADEGWLVVLTDGDFDSDIPSDGLKADLSAKAGAQANLFVQYLAIGTDVQNIPEGNSDAGFYAQKAGNTSEVVNELAEISNRIFKRNEYSDYEEGKKLDFDIPLSKLIVFAQGKDVKINSLKNKEGGEVKLQDSCAVSYSSTDGSGLTSYVTETPSKDTSLKGEVAIFADTSPIVEGSYTLDISGADTVKVYYEPDVKFGIRVFNGDRQVEGDTIEGGACTVQMGFINQLSEKFIEKSKLLGEAKYVLVVNGEKQECTGKGGAMQSIDLEAEGDTLELQGEVTYLNNYIDSTSWTYQVCTLEMEADVPKGMQLKELEEEGNVFTVSAMKNGAPLTEEQWNGAAVDIKAVDQEGKESLIDWEVQKGDTVSTWKIFPKYKNGDMFKTGTGDIDLTIGVSTEIDGKTYGRSKSVQTNINDDKTIVDYLKHYWKQIVISLFVLILLLGYVPPFKKRFSRTMKRRPTINGEAQKIGINDMMVKGNFEKNILSSLLPYTPETGRLTFSPAPVKKTARVRSAGGASMMLINTSAFAGKEEVTFNGMSIPENYKGLYRLSASTIIVVSTLEYEYTCIPNVQRTADGSIKRAKGKKKKR